MALAPQIRRLRDKTNTTRRIPLILCRTDWRTSRPRRTRTFEAPARRERHGWFLRDSLIHGIFQEGRRDCMVSAENGADVNIRGRWDTTPLHYASDVGF